MTAASVMAGIDGILPAADSPTLACPAGEQAQID